MTSESLFREGVTAWHVAGDLANGFMEGGCGSFALAMKEAYPHVKIAAEVDHEGFVSHAWAYDGTYRYDADGATEWSPLPDNFCGAYRDSVSVELDVSQEWLEAAFRRPLTTNDHYGNAFPTVIAMGVTFDTSQLTAEWRTQYFGFDPLSPDDGYETDEHDFWSDDD